MKKTKNVSTEMKKKHKFLVPLLSFILVAAIGVGGSYAILTAATNEVTNVFTLGNIRTEIVEDTETYGYKNVYIVNTGKSDCQVRARVVVTPEDLVTITYNTKDWELREDGYWYYIGNDGVLKAQGSASKPFATPSLIESYSVKGVVDGKVQAGAEVPDFDITVSQESIQVNKSWDDYNAK